MTDSRPSRYDELLVRVLMLPEAERRPFETKGLTLPQILERILHEDAPKPSHRVAALGDPAAAEALYEQALEIRENALEPGHGELLDAQREYAAAALEAKMAASVEG